MSGEARRAVFFDRDGVVNRSPGEGYVLSPGEFILNDGIAAALRLIRSHGILAIVVTSQKGVGKGLMTRGMLDEIHQRMAALLAAEGTAFDAIYSHTGTGGPEDYPPKPDPGMIFAASERFGLDLRQSWLIGDADRDIAMAIAAGLAGTIRIQTDKPIGIEASHTLEETLKIPQILSKVLKF
jgi:D-glycero-D-manno-heptose 1,7-bisphosphate phosphatase